MNSTEQPPTQPNTYFLIGFAIMERFLVKESALLFKILQQRLESNSPENKNQFTSIFENISNKFLLEDDRLLLRNLLSEVVQLPDNKSRLQKFSYLVTKETSNKIALIKFIKSIIMEKRRIGNEGFEDIMRADYTLMKLHYIQNICDSFHINIQIIAEQQSKQINIRRKARNGAVLFNNKINILYGTPTVQYLLYKKSHVREMGIKYSKSKVEKDVYNNLSHNLQLYYDKEFEHNTPDILYQVESAFIEVVENNAKKEKEIPKFNESKFVSKEIFIQQEKKAFDDRKMFEGVQIELTKNMEILSKYIGSSSGAINELLNIFKKYGKCRSPISENELGESIMKMNYAIQGIKQHNISEINSVFVELGKSIEDMCTVEFLDQIALASGIFNGNQKIELECAICLEDLGKMRAKMLSCGHSRFHQKCIRLWMQREKICPICRTAITPS